MKKVFLILGIAYAGSSFCQIEKGTLLVGPSVSFSQSKNEITQQNFQFSPQTSSSRNLNGSLRLGYFVIDKLALGLIWQNSGYVNNSETRSTNSTNTNTSKQAVNYFGLFGRYYKMVNEGKIGFFGQLDLMYGIGKRTYEDETTNLLGTVRNENKGDITALRVGLAPGIVYFANERLAFETYFGGLSFISQTDKNFSNGQAISENKANNFNLSFGAGSFYFGLNFYFGRKKT